MSTLITKKATNAGIAIAASDSADTNTLSAEYNWHPGLPGYAVTYRLTACMNRRPLKAQEVCLRCDTAGVELDGLRVTVPEAVRQQGKDLTVTVLHPETGKSCRVIIPCKTWEMTFSDEFEGGRLEPSIWADHGVGDAYQCADTSVAQVMNRSITAANCHQVRDGCLELLCKDEPMYSRNAKYLYTHCCVDTHKGFSQRFGCFMCRMAYPPQGGLNSAFWLLPMYGSYGRLYSAFVGEAPNLGLSEIDVIEATVNWNNKYCISEHYYDYTDGYAHKQRSQYVQLDGNITDFHTYSCVWQEDALYYYCDNELVMATTGLTMQSVDGREPLPVYMLLSMAMYVEDDPWIGKHTFTKEDFPIKTRVDWVRAYK